VTAQQFDALIVGGGGAGLWAALELAQAGVQVAVLSKLHPLRSHTGAAQGGICAALGNLEEDHWEWHMFDTVKGGDYLVDQDAAEILAREAIETVLQLEHMGLPFDRTPDGRIDQKAFGGHSREYGQGPIRRSCFAADRTGMMILQTLFQQCLKAGVQFFNEFQVLDLVADDRNLGTGGRCIGVVAYQIVNGQISFIGSKAVLLATGGFGRMFRSTTNAWTLTGDGVALAYRQGIPLQDMEFFQFHPTGVVGLGILLSEAARGEGAYLLNDGGERFMARYASKFMELAPRDLVSRAIYQEIREGRGIGGRDYVHLDVRHLGRDAIDRRLPEVAELVRTYVGRDPATQPIPIHPTAHYAMGGIPTNANTQVTRDENCTVVPGLYAAGECACVSVHGANRLGTNSLVDLLVFGRRAGKQMAADLSLVELPTFAKDPTVRVSDELRGLRGRREGFKAADLQHQLAVVMTDKVGVFRDGATLMTAISEIRDIKDRYKSVVVQDKGAVFNTDLLEARELGHLLDCAEATAASAFARNESRGAHAREDHPQRDDENYLRHTLVFKDEGGPTIRYKPVTITRFKPLPRTY
jgi:succinate dehydrogenase / fumarate reductase, flavoprotein subunit